MYSKCVGEKLLHNDPILKNGTDCTLGPKDQIFGKEYRSAKYLVLDGITVKMVELVRNAFPRVKRITSTSLF